MKNIVKIFSLVLVLMLTVALFALPVFAQSEDDSVSNTDGSVGSAGTEIMPEGGEGAPEIDEAPKAIEINFNLSRFVDSLQYMWKGMLCIFIVIGVIVLITYFFNRFVNYLAFASEKKNSDNEE